MQLNVLASVNPNTSYLGTYRNVLTVDIKHNFNCIGTCRYGTMDPHWLTINIPRKKINIDMLESGRLTDSDYIFFSKLFECVNDIEFTYNPTLDCKKFPFFIVKEFVENVINEMDSTQLLWEVKGMLLTYPEYLKYQKFLGIMTTLEMIPDIRKNINEIVSKLF